LAKAVLPLLSRADGNLKEYRRILYTAVFQALFLSLPLAASLIVLRIPLVRLVYGTKIFDWEATVQTGMVLSVYAMGIASQALMAILARAFFALHDSKTPVKVSFLGLGLLVIGDFLLVMGLKLPVWALAASFSFSTLVEAIVLVILINKRIGGIINKKFFIHLGQIFSVTLLSGFSMYFLLKIFDKSVWVKRLSFLSGIDAISVIPFDRFVLDTRYAFNVLVLTVVTFFIGMLVYIVLSLLFKVEETKYFLNVAKRLISRKIYPEIPAKEQEPVSPTTTDAQEQ
jgi:putative peptidoglycan lipid II flippase